MADKTELKSNIEWKQWGRDDPLWGVISWANKQRGGSSPWTEEEFYAVGESDYQDFIRQWQHYGLQLDSCLEIGCGAGRLTRQLSTAFREVYAVDVSEEMIARARGVAGTNVHFSLVDGLRLPQCDCSVTAIFSVLVLQHLDNTEAGFSYFEEFFRVLSAGGTLMIQIPLYRFPFRSKVIQWSMERLHAFARQLGGVRADIKRRAGTKLMRVTPYSIEMLSERMARIGFKNIEFRLFPAKSNGDLYSFVFATK